LTEQVFTATLLKRGLDEELKEQLAKARGCVMDKLVFYDLKSGKLAISSFLNQSNSTCLPGREIS
jgi:hypothetical protein